MKQLIARLSQECLFFVSEMKAKLELNAEAEKLLQDELSRSKEEIQTLKSSLEEVKLQVNFA